jgi:TolB-like protein
MAEERVQRKLAAIMAADVVGYSRLMGEDEAGTLDRVKILRTELLDPETTRFGGRIFKTTGDGFLAEFPSATDAVQCAVEVQRELAGREDDLPEERRIVLRVGLSLGDVIVDGDDLYGNGVNVAARMEGLAEPGSICISSNVHEHVRGAPGLSFQDLGPQTVKNIAEPVHAYSFVPMVTPTASNTVVLSEKPSIAVLPFENMSGDSEQEYFADGMAEEIITALSRFRWFYVTARNSSFSYKGRNVDVRTVGRDLGVRYVLEGSVRKGGSRLRVTAQLIETGTGNHLWAERYDGAIEDVFDLQDKIAEGVTAAIEPSVRQAEIERARRKRSENLDAYDLYLQALPHAWAYTREGTARAGELLEEAIRIDPGYAAAHGLAAWCYAIFNREGGHTAEGREAGIRHARTVLSLGADDSAALAYAAFTVSLFEGNHDVALDAARKALALTPNSAVVLGLVAVVHSFASQFDRTVELAQRSLALSPLDPFTFLSDLSLAWAHLFNGKYADAVEAAQRAVHSNSSFIPGYVGLAVGYVCLEQDEMARSVTGQILAVNPAFRIGDITSLPRFAPEEREFLGDCLRKAGLPD